MVLEALAAVGLASNVAQFVDFSCELFSQTRSIHSSHAGSSDRRQDTETLAHYLQELCVKLSGGCVSRVDLSPRDEVLMKLAQDCRNAAAELLQALQDLGAKNPKSKWSSFQAALATTWKQEKIDAMGRTLEFYRSQLILQLQTMRSDEHSAILDSLDDLNGATRQLSAELTSHVAEVKLEVRDALHKIEEELSRQAHDSRPQAASAQLDRWTRRSEALPQQTEGVDELAKRLSQTAKSGKDIVVSMAILGSLRFNQMDFRHSNLPVAHHRTFRWIYSKRFKQWLESDEPFFWISGKPGCGKSTLMKYLVDNQGTPLHLREWSGDRKIVVASYFFWINGTHMQKSQEGLLLSLLFEILRQSPELIEKTFPEQYRMLSAMGSYSYSWDWSRAELLAAYRRLTEHNVTTARFCVFVDGLDEYAGDHEELIEVVKSLARTTNVKLCIASRPWNVFESAFGAGPKLYLQDLNRRDIQLYVKSQLEDRPDFRRIRLQEQPIADQLTVEIVDKAQGVFLWVRLVVRSLIEGLRNCDPIPQLQKRLRDFPLDLDSFFTHILESIDPHYRAQTAHSFQVTLAAQEPLSLLGYWYLDEEEDCHNIAHRISIRSISKIDLKAKNQEMFKRINGRSKGLLEVTTTADTQADEPFKRFVVFLHRTVTDFLMTKGVQQTLARWTSEGFDPDLSICKATLAEFKTVLIKRMYLDGRKYQDGQGPMFPLVVNFFSSARELEKRTETSPIELLNEFDRTIQVHVKSYLEMDGNLWVSWGARSFITFAITRNLLLYVDWKLGNNDSKISKREKKQMLSYALAGAVDPLMVPILLKHGPPVSLDKDLSVRLVELIEGASNPDRVFGVLKALCEASSLELKSDQLRDAIAQRLSLGDLADLDRVVRRAKRRHMNPFKWPWKLKKYV